MRLPMTKPTPAPLDPAKVRELADHGDLFSFGGAALEEFVPRQRDLIEQVENTAFGGYLDAWVKTYLDLQRSDVTGQVRHDKGIQLNSYEDWVRRMGGPAGQQINFTTLREDIDAVLRQLKDGLRESADDAASRSKSSGNAARGSKSRGNDCGGVGATSIAKWSGGLRW